MADTIKVRIGMQMARELEFEVDDAEAMVKSLEKALGNGDALVWIADSKGHRHGIAVSKIAFLEVQGEEHPFGVGFGSTRED
jgi:hypothetical protein